MEVIGSIIARLGSKRLPYKNILPVGNRPMVLHGIDTLLLCPSIERVIVSTESPLIQAIVQAAFANNPKVIIHMRSEELAADNTPSIPVFKDIIDHFPANIHVNYNFNIFFCPPAVIERAIELAREHEEALSVPYAAWAQSSHRLHNYKNPWEISAYQFKDDRAYDLDIHTPEDLLEANILAKNQLQEPEFSNSFTAS